MSQAETLRRHAAEKRARVAANSRAAKLRDEAQRRANGAREANATAGSKARKLVGDRRADRAKAQADKTAAKHERDQQRAEDARARQKAKDEDERDMKTKDDQDAQDEADARDEGAQAGNAPKGDEQEPKEKGPLQDFVIGAIHKENWDRFKESFKTSHDLFYSIGLQPDSDFGTTDEEISRGRLNAWYSCAYAFFETTVSRHPDWDDDEKPWDSLVRIFKKGKFDDDRT
jgi:hypothetical protein